MTFTVDNASNAKSAINITGDSYLLLRDVAQNPTTYDDTQENYVYKEIGVVEDVDVLDDALRFIEFALDEEADVKKQDDLPDVDVNAIFVDLQKAVSARNEPDPVQSAKAPLQVLNMVPCAAHTLQLSVKKSLAKKEVSSAIKYVR